MFCKILNNRLVQCLDKGGALHERQAGFRVNRSCMDNVYTLNEIVQGRFREDKETYAFFLDVQKAYHSKKEDISLRFAVSNSCRKHVSVFPSLFPTTKCVNFCYIS